jgi:hypothetical protein
MALKGLRLELKRREVIIYLLAYPLFEFINSILSDICRILFQPHFFSFSYFPIDLGFKFCYRRLDNWVIYASILFFLLKILIVSFVILFSLNSKNIKAKSVLNELLIAYLAFDLIYVLTGFVKFIPLSGHNFIVNNLYAAHSMSSGGFQPVLAYIFHTPFITVSIFWSVVLLFFVRYIQKLSVRGILERCFLIGISYVFFAELFSMIFWYCYWHGKH